MFKRLASFLALAACVSSLSAASIFSNAITGTNPNASNPYTTGQTLDTNLSATGIGRGSGITGTNASDRYNATTWGATLTEAAAITGSKYFTFTLTPDAGFEIDFTSFNFVVQASGTGPRSLAVFSSVGGFSVGKELLTYTDSGSSTYTSTQSLNLSSVSFQSITAPIEFRIYAWNGASTGTFSINSFDFSGAVGAVTAPIPEPSTYALGAAGVIGLVTMLRRRRPLA